MKKDIHPTYVETKVTCSCGNTFMTRSTSDTELRPEICSNCHPFYTGKQKAVDTMGRVGRFQEKYKNKAAPVAAVKAEVVSEKKTTAKAAKPAAAAAKATKEKTTKAKSDKKESSKKTSA